MYVDAIIDLHIGVDAWNEHGDACANRHKNKNVRTFLIMKT